MGATIPKLVWEKSGHLPGLFSWLARYTHDRPTIWARPTAKGWYCQFAHFQYSASGTGTTRDKAANELVTSWHSAMTGKTK